MVQENAKEVHAKANARKRVRTYLDKMRARRLRGLVVEPVVHNGPPHKAWPVTYPYGAKNSSYAAGYHTGEDHACPIGERAQACSFGRVVFVGWGGNAGGWGPYYGNQIVIRMAGGKYDYGHNHLSHINVKVGDTVKPGEQVGKTGDTGNVTGPHDHFEARTAGGHYGSDVHPIRVKQRVKAKK